VIEKTEAGAPSMGSFGAPAYQRKTIPSYNKEVVMYDQNVLEAAAGDPREQVERELTDLVASLVDDIKSLAHVVNAQQQRLNRLELAIAGRAVRS
jgi:hypothetical protein